MTGLAILAVYVALFAGSALLITDIVLMGIILIGIIGYGIDVLMRLAERRLVPWKGKS